MENWKLLHESPDSVYYSGEHQKYPGRLLFKFLRTNKYDYFKLQRLTNEFQITSNLLIPGVRKSFGIEELNGNLTLIMEYIEGKNLKELVKEKKISIPVFLHYAQQITQVLHEIHEQNIIHKDISSKNILVSRSDDRIYIIDFGISTKINLHTQQLLNPDQLEGSLGYISPEQTGRMNRSVDYRTDFYSLGITFYEMLCGKLPFPTDDPVELVYCHIAKFPEPLNSLYPEIPEMISKIVDKLLSKNAEDRYKSALGILRDLNRCEKQLIERGAIENFQLAENDYSGKFQLPQKLYGRENDILELLGCFERTMSGGCEMVIVSGYPGVGKTALIHEMQKPVTASRGFFIEGKFDQFQRNIPYAPFQQAFTDFINHLLAGSADSLENWKNNFQSALGNNGKVLTDVIPNLEIIIGPQETVPQVSSIEQERRFNYEFVNFIKCIASENSPLVMFLDDFQWSDAASLNLLTQLIGEGIPYFMLISSYRDNEVNNEHPWMITVSQIRKTKTNIINISLSGLNADHVNQLIADTLNLPPEKTMELSTLINQKTKGNPFFIGQFLKTLHGNNIILWNTSRNVWMWSLEEIRAMDVTDNVVDFLSIKMENLSPQTYRMLQHASCIGNRFSVALLGKIASATQAMVNRAMYESMEEGYVIPLYFDRSNLTVNNTEELADVTYKFTHDRIQQAVHSIIEDKEKSTIHFKIGSYLLENGDRATEIFRITDHLNNADVLISTRLQRGQLAELNYDAGIKARNNNAHDAALRYFNTCRKMLDDQYWNDTFDFIFRVMLATAEENYINRYEKEAEEILETVWNHARDPVEKALVLEKKVLLYAHMGRLNEGLEIGRQALALLGVSLPKNKFTKKAGIAFQLMKASRAMKRKSHNDILNLPELSSREGKILSSLVGYLFMTLYYTDPESFIFMALFVVNYSLKNGNSSLSPLAYISLAIVNAAFFQKYQAAYELALTSFDLNGKFANGTVKGRVILNFAGGISHWVKPVDQSIEQLYAGYKVCMENGDLPYAIDTVIVNFSMQLFSGRNLHALLAEFEVYSPFIREANDDKQHYDFLQHISTVKNLMAPEEDADEQSAYDNNFLLNNSNHFTRGYFFTTRALYYLLTARPTLALKYTTEGIKILDGYKASIVQAQVIFYHAMAMALNHEGDASSSKKNVVSELQKALKQYTKWAASCPGNFAPFKMFIESELERMEAGIKVSDYYQQTISLARKNKFIYLEAFANERLGSYCLQIHLDKAAGFYLNEALILYERWGALVKVNLMKLQYPEIRYSSELAQNSEYEHSLNRSSSHSSDVLDMITVLKSCTALSSEIQIDKLLNVFMKIIMENAGAQRGYFILIREKRFLSRIEGTHEEGAIEKLELLDKSQVPDSIIQYVKRTKENVVLADVSGDTRFRSDTYFIKNTAKSVLCVPILTKGAIIAIIYLENNLATGAFGSNRIELIKLLSGQIVVSLENSLHYENLEQKVKDRTEEVVKQRDLIETEKLRSDTLLLNILPEEIAEELKSSGNAKPRRFENVSVMFTDFVNFTKLSEELSADKLVELINFYYCAFDEIIARNKLEKIKTIGDSYMCASGLPELNPDHARCTINTALDILDFISNAHEICASQGTPSFECRIGINSGAVVAGIVGIRKFAYDIWGDTVNTAARLQQNSEPGKINISGTTLELIAGQFNCTYRGRIEAKNKGLIDMYFVDGRKQISSGFAETLTDSR